MKNCAMQENFDRDLMILLHDIARTLRTRADQLARSHGMTRAQWIILARLARQPGISQNEMANVCEVEPITVGRLIDRLEAHGLVERRADPKDRRVRRLHLLPPAESILEEIGGYRKVLNEMIVDGLDEAQREKLIDILLFIKTKLTTGNTPAAKLQMAGE
jgi:DNA-binding MarR family transcriptional regulator